MVLAALSTGFRCGELLGLRWEDIRWADERIDLRRQLQRGEPVKPKYSSYREVPLYSGLRMALGRRRRAEGHVFADAHGDPWGDTGPDREFLSAAYERAGLRCPGVLWHSLRHTYASILAAGGIREDVGAQLMGHNRQGTTALYSHLFADAFEGVEKALDAVLGPALRVSPASVNGAVSEGHSENVADSRSGENGPIAAVLGE
jgi:integrase